MGAHTVFEIGEYADFHYSGYQCFNTGTIFQEFHVNGEANAHISIDANARKLGSGYGVAGSRGMSIGKGADFSITTNGDATFSPLLVQSELAIGDNASFKVLAFNNYASTKLAALSVGANNATVQNSILFNHPKSVLIYNSNDNAPAISYVSEGYFESIANQIEYWDSAELAGDHNHLNGDSTSHVWKQASDFTVNAHIIDENIIGALNHVNYDGNQVLDHNTFYFKKQSVLQIRSIPDVPPIMEQSKNPKIDAITEIPAILTGTGIAGAEIKITLPNGEEITTTVLSGNVWYFLLPRGTTFKIGDTISVTQTEIEKEVSESVIRIVTGKDT